MSERRSAGNAAGVELLCEPLHVSATGVLEAESLVEQRRIRPVQRGGDDEPIGSALARPLLRDVHQRSAYAAPAHLGWHHEGGELGDGECTMQNGSGVHARQTDDRSRRLGDECVVAGGAQTSESADHVRRFRGISKVRQQRAHRGRIAIGRRADGHCSAIEVAYVGCHERRQRSEGATCARQTAYPAGVMCRLSAMKSSGRGRPSGPSIGVNTSTNV